MGNNGDINKNYTEDSSIFYSFLMSDESIRLFRGGDQKTIERYV